MGQLSLRQLEIFRATMRSGSLTAAAQILGITQPAASRLLRHAEDQLGMALFRRQNGRLQPTPEARALFPEVDRIYGDIEYVQRVASDLHRLRAGRLHIAAIPSLAITVLARAVGAFVGEHPSVTISTSTVLNFQVPDMVANRRADLGLAFMPIPDHDLDIVEIARTRIVAVLPPKHPLAEKPHIVPADLVGQPLISFSNSLPIGERIEAAFRREGLNQPMAIEVGNSFVACAFVRSGAGIALVDDLAVESGAFPDLQVRPVVPRLEISAVLVTAADLRPSLVASAFAEKLRSGGHAPPER